MRLSRVDLPGFGCLRDFEAELAPGLNLFHGLNEAGKSTLQQAVLALLYGFFDQDRARPDETARHERFRPWSGSEYHGLLEYELADERRFQVRRDFATPDIPTQLIDLTTGQDVASQFGRGRHGNVPFARRHLGMSRAVFERCAFISQGEIFEVSRGASPREIGDAIASLADSARRDVSAANALQRLNDLIGKIGSDRARTADLPRGREHLRGAQGELQALDAARQALSERAAERDRLQSALVGLDGEIARHELLVCQARAADVAGRLGQLADADETIREAQERQAALKPYAAVPHHLRDEVLSLSGRRQTISDTLHQLEPRIEHAAVAEDDRIQYVALEAEVGVLTPDQVVALQAIAYAPAPARRGLRATLLAAARALAAAVAAAVRALLRLLLRRTASPEPEAGAAAPTVTAAEAASLLEKHRRYLTQRPAVENLAHLQSEHAAAAADLAAVDGQLQGLLASSAISPTSEDGVQAFLDACRRRQEYEAALSAQQEAERRRRAILQGRSPQELEGQRQLLEAQAQRLLALHPHLQDSQSDEAPEELAARLEELRRQREQARLREAQLKGEIEQAFSQHRPRPEIEEEIERWQREVSRLGRARAAAEMAKAAIEEAVTEVYRNFAPRVNEFLSQGVEFVTEGRYRHVFVDPGSLKISLEVPEISQVLTDPPISHGTRTLVYVLMRVGLAQHMSSIHEPVPLVLDDPFVDIDSRRLPRLLAFLARLSEERGIQVLLFSKDEHTLRWFEESALEPQHRLHRLPALDEARLQPSGAASSGRRLL